MNNSKVSFLVLDYAKPDITKRCLQSLEKHCATINKEVLLLSNGLCSKPLLKFEKEANPEYPFYFMLDGLVDQLLVNKQNNGCGNATDQLFRAANCEWAFYIQNDQALRKDITPEIVNDFIKFLTDNPEYLAIDLAGCQAGINKYSERAHFINVKRYLYIYRGIKGEIGGPGPYNYNKYSEQWVQEYCTSNNLLIAGGPPIFADNGLTSVREIGDGVYVHRCDTKQLWVLKKPTFKTAVHPPLNEEEWKIMLEGKWVDGTIPEHWKPHSFKCWA